MFNDSQFRFITCDGPKCKKEGILLETSDAEKTKKVMDENPWLKSPRVVTAGSKKNIVMTAQGPQVQETPNNYLFCSDTCLVDAAAAGMFISEAERKIIPPDNNMSPEAAIKKAAADKAAVDAADAALRKGEDVRIKVATR
jgi:hypothetical protein